MALPRIAIDPCNRRISSEGKEVVNFRARIVVDLTPTPSMMYTMSPEKFVEKRTQDLVVVGVFSTEEAAFNAAKPVLRKALDQFNTRQ